MAYLEINFTQFSDFSMTYFNSVEIVWRAIRFTALNTHFNFAENKLERQTIDMGLKARLCFLVLCNTFMLLVDQCTSSSVPCYDCEMYNIDKKEHAQSDAAFNDQVLINYIKS